MIANTRKVLRRAALLMLALGLAACESSTEAEEHNEAEGLVIVDEATNEVLVTVNGQQRTGSLTVRAGQERAIEVFFLNPEGERFELDGDDHTLGYTVANPAVANLSEHDGHLDLDGVAAGSTTAEFMVVHGGHNDYESPSIPITVTP
jgi:hypothetical protein